MLKEASLQEKERKGETGKDGARIVQKEEVVPKTLRCSFLHHKLLQNLTVYLLPGQVMAVLQTVRMRGAEREEEKVR